MRKHKVWFDGLPPYSRYPVITTFTALVSLPLGLAKYFSLALGIARNSGCGHNSAMDIFRVFQVEAAHRLPNVPEGHKCARLHGHSFRIEVHVSGPVGEQSGWVMDFADLRKIFQPVFDQLDHHYLNEIDGLENPTSENLARWIWHQLKPGLAGLSKISVQETCNAGCVYDGE